jgi:platelet-activating factor acetylhydrolase IB subunit alpha
MRIWDLKTGQCMKQIEVHSLFVQCLAWGHVRADGKDAADTADGIVNVIATGGTDKVCSMPAATRI